MSVSLPSSQLLQNAIDTLSIDNLLESGQTIQLRRMEVAVDLIKPEPLSDEYRAHRPYAVREGGIPPRRPSALGPPGNLVLSCSIDKEPIGDGRSSLVYEVQNEILSDPNVSVPPLVLKIARNNMYFNIDFALEKWFYDEMESIQGVAIPRCYGLFKVGLSEDLASDVRPWKLPQATIRLEEQSVLDSNYSNDHDDIRMIKGEEDYLYVMVLERLGGMLPVGEPISEEDRNDVKGLYEDLGPFCVCLHWQVRHENILHAPVCPPGLAGKPSEVKKKTHNWRLVDFSSAFKQALSERQMLKLHMSWVERLLNGLPSGRLLEPF
ncbi:hypothetical protein EWM64_g10300 [Hericium alpestre]|uniref:Protein kinase domain-containing protein n=1 Tax=Hericium alpestre TaxID=135208 RepID=A0A4Y9ZGI7_9AGAM|nr:hypothetical protein EWM64_g10300 [Hericium alpestre]